MTPSPPAGAAPGWPRACATRRAERSVPSSRRSVTRSVTVSPAAAPPPPTTMAAMDERKAVDTVIRWLRVRERSGHPAPTSYAELVDAIYNSALLRRMLSGKTPLRVAPPRSFGQPWYALIENGTAGGCELRMLKDRPGATPRVAINEWAWEVVDASTEDRLLVRYSREAPVFVAERESAEPETWRLVRRDLWAAQAPPATAEALAAQGATRA